MTFTCVRRRSYQVGIKELIQWPDGGRERLELCLSGAVAVALALGGRVLYATFSVVRNEDR